MNKENKYMRKTIGLLIGVVALVAAGLTIASVAEAHTNVGHSADCNGVAGLFENFPQGEQEVTVYMGDFEVDQTFQGPAGSVSASWADVGIDTSDGLEHTYGFSWSADGGGSTELFTFDAVDCVPPVTTVPPPPTTIPPPDCYDPYTPGAPGCPTVPPTTDPPPPPTTDPAPPERDVLTCANPRVVCGGPEQTG